MQRRLWTYGVWLPLIASWGIDRGTKYLATWITGSHSLGPFGIALQFNHGVMLGSFADLPPILRIVSLSTGGAFLLVSFFIIQYLLPFESLPFRSGMSVMIGGILGNVTDRIRAGSVTDFLFVGGPTSPIFNLADVFQWIGLGMMILAVIRDRSILWPQRNMRKSFWVNARFQLRYSLKLVVLGLGFATVVGTYSYTFLKVALSSRGGYDPVAHGNYLSSFFITFVALSLAFSVVLFLTGVVFSHRAAGPIFAFERFLKDLFNGTAKPLRLRAGDEFSELERLADQLLKSGLPGTTKKP